MENLSLIGIEYIQVKNMTNIVLDNIKPQKSVEITDTEYDENLATITLESNKLILSKESIRVLGVVPGDKVAINYWSVDSSNTFPIIGRGELFENTGNRLTKSNTVSYRGEQNTILREYGTVFKLVRFKSFFKLEKIEMKPESDDLSEEENYLNDLN